MSKRLVDKKIENYLSIFGAVNIVGPKWCSKTWTSLNKAKSVTFMYDDNNKDKALMDPKSIFVSELNKRSQLIDEWY